MAQSVFGRPSRESYRRQVLARWKRSGPSVRAFCGAEGLNPMTFVGGDAVTLDGNCGGASAQLVGGGTLSATGTTFGGGTGAPTMTVESGGHLATDRRFGAG